MLFFRCFADNKSVISKVLLDNEVNNYSLYAHVVKSHAYVKKYHSNSRTFKIVFWYVENIEGTEQKHNRLHELTNKYTIDDIIRVVNSYKTFKANSLGTVNDEITVYVM